MRTDFLRYLQCLIGNRVRSAFESIVVDQCVAQRHDIGVHAVLVREIDNSLWVIITQQLKQADVQSTTSSLCILDLFLEDLRTISRNQYCFSLLTIGGSWK